jgi:4-amino-4-deoxy-L-arabinose transferase-like glycosyltransferase
MLPTQINQAADYHVVFSVLQKSPPRELLFVVPAVIAIATIIALVLVIRRKASLILIGIVYVVFLLIALLVSPFPGVQDMYARAKNAFLHGQYSIAEGPVADFHPMPYSGHQMETFSVNGVQFSYSDYVIVPCFNNTASHGGPIHQGLRVRIAYSGDCILKLEVASDP